MPSQQSAPPGPNIAAYLFPGESSTGDSGGIQHVGHYSIVHWIKHALSQSKFYADHCSYLFPMLGWFLFSALLSSYNKIVFGDDHMNFPCPLLLTSIHFASQWAFSWTICTRFPDYFGSQRIDDMSWSEFLGISIPCGLVTSGDVGLSNLSLVTISMTFYTMVKASTPVFVLIWAYFFGIIRITWALCGVVLVIAIGEFFTVLGEVEFKFTGFLLCLMASVLSGARWTLVQLKIQSLDPPLKTTVATMRVLSPFMFASMLLTSFLLEQPWIALDGVIDSWRMFFTFIGLGLVGAFFAIFMIMFEFWLIMHTSAIILMIGGVIKEMLTIFIGVTCFGDTLNWINFGGCVIVFIGVILYKITFHREKEAAKAKAAVGLEKDPDTSATIERQPLRHAKDDNDEDSDNNDPELDAQTNGFRDNNDDNSIELRRSINGQQDGIEMRHTRGRNNSID